MEEMVYGIIFGKGSRTGQVSNALQMIGSVLPELALAVVKLVGTTTARPALSALLLSVHPAPFPFSRGKRSPSRRAQLCEFCDTPRKI